MQQFIENFPTTFLGSMLGGALGMVVGGFVNLYQHNRVFPPRKKTDTDTPLGWMLPGIILGSLSGWYLTARRIENN